MAELVRVAVDAMGGDNAPTEIIKGVVEAVHADERVKVFLVGQEDVVKKELAAYSYPAERIEVVHASEVIETGEPPVNAIRGKKDSSIVKGFRSGEKRRMRRVCICGKHRRGFSWRTGVSRQGKGRGASRLWLRLSRQKMAALC